MVGLQQYTHLMIQYVLRYLLHDTIRIVICFSDLRIILWWSTKVLTRLQSLFEMVHSHSQKDLISYMYL